MLSSLATPVVRANSFSSKRCVASRAVCRPVSNRAAGLNRGPAAVQAMLGGGGDEDDRPKLTRSKEPKVCQRACHVLAELSRPRLPGRSHAVLLRSARFIINANVALGPSQEYWKSEGEREGKSPLQDPARARNSDI